ncbi:MAG: hypothetical protein K0R26_346 [Bacteroidota bacterium]|jgi:uncharacterized protein (TIGR01777 family)|nr:hypothetical protein [Bacteroidota bacterium]
MAVILISGGSGLVGKALTARLLDEKHEVRILSRNPSKGYPVPSYYWNIEKKEIDGEAFHNVDHIVHLAGAGIADSCWTEARKKEIFESRIKSIQLIESRIIKKGIRLKSFVGASAVGFYGMRTSEKIYKETDGSGNDLLSDVCVQWEKSYEPFINYSDKHCVIRTSVVLSREGGALQKLIPLFKAGFGSAIGNGRQYMPWIHPDDLVSIYMKALFDPEYHGVYNAASSHTVTNETFSQTLAKELGKPYFMPAVPGFILKIIFGEMAGLLLNGSRVSNQKLLDAGFKFKYDSLESAFHNLIKGA